MTIPDDALGRSLPIARAGARLDFFVIADRHRIDVSGWGHADPEGAPRAEFHRADPPSAGPAGRAVREEAWQRRRRGRTVRRHRAARKELAEVAA